MSRLLCIAGLACMAAAQEMPTWANDMTQEELDELENALDANQDDLWQAFRQQEMSLEALMEKKKAKQAMAEQTRTYMDLSDEQKEQMVKDNLGATVDALTAIRKFRNLKAMVMVLQPANVTIFGRYCYYGCWCLPNGQHNLASGFGQPVDPLDEVCKEFALCYKCLDIDFGGQCDPRSRGYQWARNKVLGVVVDVTCKNTMTTQTKRCARYTCECDRILAVGLGNFHWYWNISYHARWGNFDRQASCFPNPGQYRQDDCCGGYGAASPYWGDIWIPFRRPYATTNPTTACCQDVYYYDYVNTECCLDSSSDVIIVPKNECVSNHGGSVLPADDVDDFKYTK